MKRMVHLLAMALTVSMLFASCKGQEKETPKHLDVGDSLPSFTVTTTEGETYSSDKLIRPVTVIANITTTCPDCQAQLPILEEVYRKISNTVFVLCIARDESPETVEAYWEKNGYGMPVAAPGNREIYDMFDRGSNTGVPQLYVTDKDGKIAFFADASKTVTYKEFFDLVLEIFGDFYINVEEG